MAKLDGSIFVNLKKGRKVNYKLENGKEVEIIIDGELSASKNNSSILGYDAIFLDDNKRYFADASRIL